MTKISVINQPRYEASVDQWVRNIKNAAIKIVNEVVSEEVVPPHQWPKVGLKATKSLVKKAVYLHHQLNASITGLPHLRQH